MKGASICSPMSGDIGVDAGDPAEHVRSSYRASRSPSFSVIPDRNRGLRSWCQTFSKRRP
jgi:hypothetical protein